MIGLGYVGLPLALELGKHFEVIGFDKNEAKINIIKTGRDPSRELSEEKFIGKTVKYTSNANDLRTAHFHIVAVPTPIDDKRIPDLSYLVDASIAVGKNLKPGDYVVYESTVYPSCTEEDCLPILEKHSGLKVNKDFKLGYSPERINPGDTIHTVDKIIKVVSGSDDAATAEIARVYETITEAGVYKASSIKVAEAAKIIENTQRDLNIAFVNELAIIFEKMNINTLEVLAAAGTKWNFIPFRPGLVGGHCIGVDPYYLLHKSRQIGYEPEVILSGRRINDQMHIWLAGKVVQELVANGLNPGNSRALIMGITFKENVRDIRNSKVFGLASELRKFGLKVDLTDSMASPEEVMSTYGEEIIDEPTGPFELIVVAVPHRTFRDLQEPYFKSLLHEKGLLADLGGIYYGKISQVNYLTL